MSRERNTAAGPGDLPSRDQQSSPAASPDREAAGHAIRRRWMLRGVVTLVLLTVVAASSALINRSATSSGVETALTHTIRRDNLVVSVIERGTLDSSNNAEIKCKIRGFSTVTWVIPSGSVVQPDDVLVRLDTKVMEETVSLTKTNVNLAKAKLERSRADFARAQIAIDAYLEGQFRSELKTLEKDVAVAESNLLAARKMLEQSRTLFKRGYVTDLEVEGHEFTVTRADLELKVKKTQVDVLERFTKEMRLETLKGNLRSARSKMAADTAELAMTTKQRSRAREELEACVVKAHRGGLVIHPSAAEWKDTPDISEGASVRKDQVLLLMPDLSRMRVKVGLHESVIDRVRPGMTARVTLPDRTLETRVSSVSTIARPVGWWNSDVVKYDTIIELPSVEGLKPGMSAEVEVILARYEDVLTIPVAAVVQTEGGDFAWVKTEDGMQRRVLRSGDTNDVFTVVEGGLAQGEQVVLNPLAFVTEAREATLEPRDREPDSRSPETKHGD